MGQVADFLCPLFQIQDILGAFPIPCFQQTQTYALTMLLCVTTLSWGVCEIDPFTFCM